MDNQGIVIKSITMCFLIVENKFDTLVINNDTFIEDLKMDNKAGECLMRALINKKYFIGMGSIS